MFSKHSLTQKGSVGKWKRRARARFPRLSFFRGDDGDGGGDSGGYDGHDDDDDDGDDDDDDEGECVGGESFYGPRVSLYSTFYYTRKPLARAHPACVCVCVLRARAGLLCALALRALLCALALPRLLRLREFP